MMSAFPPVATEQHTPFYVGFVPIGDIATFATPRKGLAYSYPSPSDYMPRGETGMKLPRRQFLYLAAGTAALPTVARIAWAQVYPSRPVSLVAGYAPGGGADITARLIGQWLSERLGQQFVIENRPGASSNIATEAVVRAPADGYTLLMVGSFNTINATLYDKLKYNFIRDIAPVASVIRYPYVMVVNPSVPAKTVPEFIAYAKGNPGKISMASGGLGTVGHLSGELLR